MTVTFEKFRKAAQGHLSTYFEGVSQLLDSGRSSPPPGKICLFPTVVVFTRTPTHYAFELFGARRRQGRLESKLRKAESSDVFLGDFAYDGTTEYIIEIRTEAWQTP
jgi:hypothetical protein